MKRILIFLAYVTFFTSVLYAQNDVTQFLGIPVAGTEESVISKLEEKGFELTDFNNILLGTLDGDSVAVKVVTNRNKVWRIMVIDYDSSDENQIKVKFNRLVRRFENDPDYKTKKGEVFTIPEDEDIAKEMELNKKEYRAAYYQVLSPSGLSKMYAEIETLVKAKFSAEEIKSTPKDGEDEITKFIEALIVKRLTMKSVWFLIAYSDDAYKIIRFYDNEFNKPASQQDDTI